MNILLQSTETMQYINEQGGWTASSTDARLFGTGLEAIFFCLHHRRARMQVVGEFEDVRLNFTMAVTDIRCDGRSIGAVRF